MFHERNVFLPSHFGAWITIIGHAGSRSLCLWPCVEGHCWNIPSGRYQWQLIIICLFCTPSHAFISSSTILIVHKAKACQKRLVQCVSTRSREGIEKLSNVAKSTCCFCILRFTHATNVRSDIGKKKSWFAGTLISVLAAPINTSSTRISISQFSADRYTRFSIPAPRHPAATSHLPRVIASQLLRHRWREAHFYGRIPVSTPTEFSAH